MAAIGSPPEKTGWRALLLCQLLVLPTVHDRPGESESEEASDEEEVQAAAAVAAAPPRVVAAPPAGSSTRGQSSASSSSSASAGKLSQVVDRIRDNPTLLAGTAAGLAATGGLLVLLSVLSSRRGEKQHSAGGKGSTTGPGELKMSSNTQTLGGLGVAAPDTELCSDTELFGSTRHRAVFADA